MFKSIKLFLWLSIISLFIFPNVGLCQTPITRGILKTDLNANDQSITNLGGISGPGIQTNLWLDVRAFGAVSGGADCAANIQAALDYTTNNFTAQLSGKATVYIPAGYWTITDTLRIRTSGTTLRGDGMARTRIIMYPTLNKNGIEYTPWVGDPVSTSILWYPTFQDFEIYKAAASAESASTAAAFCFTNAAGTQCFARGVFKNIRVRNWFYGFMFRHAVGVQMENVHASFNNYGFWLDKTDSAVFLNCFTGYSLYNTVYPTNRFSSTGAGFVIEDDGGASFNCAIIGGEGGLTETVFDVRSGNFSLQNLNAESVYGPTVHLKSGLNSAMIFNNRFWGGTTNPAIKFDAGQQALTTIGQNQYSVVGPPIEVNSTNIGPGFFGIAPVLVTNAGSGYSYNLPYVTMAQTNITFHAGLIGDAGGLTNAIVKSNNWSATPTLNEGDNIYLSSNGIPHAIYKVGGATTIIRLVP